MSEWKKELPDKEGFYWMKDDSGGPTSYEFKIMDGEMMYTNAALKCFLPAGTGMIESARWMNCNKAK